mgnify:CR=1 FL=1
MYIHGEMLLPDYIAIVMLASTLMFLLSATIYAIFDVLGFRLEIRHGLRQKGISSFRDFLKKSLFCHLAIALRGIQITHKRNQLWEVFI